MEIDWATRYFCLIGNPTSGSLSPFIHNNIFNLKGDNYKYLNFTVEEDDLEDALKGFASLSFKGFNVTLPYKKTIIPYLDELSNESRNIGAINTVKIKDGRFIGHNTDGLGFIKSLLDEGVDFSKMNVLLLGAGGASYSIAHALLDMDIACLTIANRSRENALKLKKNLLTRTQIQISVSCLDEIPNRSSYDLLINTTSVGMADYLDESPIDLEGFSSQLIVYDIIYKPLKTQLLREANRLGLRSYNGISMLVNQALLAQEFWSGNSMSKEDEELIFKKVFKLLDQGKEV